MKFLGLQEKSETSQDASVLSNPEECDSDCYYDCNTESDHAGANG